jgi:hypothetical protein
MALANRNMGTVRFLQDTITPPIGIVIPNKLVPGPIGVYSAALPEVLLVLQIH